MYVTITKYPYLMLDCERKAEMERLTEKAFKPSVNSQYVKKKGFYTADCIERLGVYEDTGLTPEQIMELKERDTAKVPEPAPLGMDGMVCPACGKKALPWDRFCGDCGQRFWEDE